jgi:predicted amidophosphoribosyltransferase
MKKLILKLKFFHKKDVVPFLVGRLAWMIQVNSSFYAKSSDSFGVTKPPSASLPPPSQGETIFISFIPSHWRRKYLEKGYNQSELLAKELAKQLDLPIFTLVKKKRYTVSQLKLSREQRQKNLSDVFVPIHLDQIPYGATILFVDDVTTTGSTLLQVAKVIKSERIDVKIWGAVLARHMG